MYLQYFVSEVHASCILASLEVHADQALTHVHVILLRLRHLIEPPRLGGTIISVRICLALLLIGIRIGPLPGLIRLGIRLHLSRFGVDQEHFATLLRQQDMVQHIPEGNSQLL
jgi:hypothetical protein